jgi:hypothetical protein
MKELPYLSGITRCQDLSHVDFIDRKISLVQFEICHPGDGSIGRSAAAISPYSAGPGSLWSRVLIGPLTAPPVVDGHPDGVWSQIAAPHLIFGNAAQRFGDALLGYLVSFLDVFVTNHFCRYRRACDGHRAPHAFESHVLNNVILDVQRYENCVAVHRTSDDTYTRWVFYPAHVSRVGKMLADLLGIQSYSLARLEKQGI